ncbi:RHS repeat-associated core domain-containing protein [Desulfatibacillum aliphaticivorans]|uniref:RHS repeat-associated core domain-containing protein n=1 Tax=Desulfatibacillum aliphaticivorans TaxID=218208 RepID=UPI00040B73C3|nr:RHS repeat-associated core domain-containing protein [Desulfatibacillum aliphaticivorans]
MSLHDHGGILLCQGYPPKKKVDYANGVTTEHTYDPDSTRLMAIQTSYGATDYQNYAYTYTDGGNIASITDNMRSHAYTYAYDDLHRLTSEASTTGSMAWTYDSIGNILTKSQDGSSMIYAYNSVTHKLDTVTAGGTVYNYSYDANGNITACPKLEGAGSISATLAIDYNADNMPTQVVKSVSGQPDVTTNFYYDGNGARVRKEVVGESTTFYAGSLYEVKDGVATKYIFGADRRIAKITDGEGVQYFSKDHLGSSTVVTDDSGAVVEQADYRPFGEDRFYTGSVATPTPYKYTDQELDESTGLYNYDARHYDPAIGRFISPDSLIPNLYDPQQLNPYAYCRNNPLRYTDPSGHFGFAGAGIGAAVGGFCGALSGIANGKSLSSKIAGGIVGGLVGFGVGAVTGTANPALSSMAASYYGGLAGRATTGFIDAAYDNNDETDPYAEAINQAGDLKAQAMDIGNGLASGGMTTAAKNACTSGTMTAAEAKLGEAIATTTVPATYNTVAATVNVGLESYDNSVASSTQKKDKNKPGDDQTATDQSHGNTTSTPSDTVNSVQGQGHKDKAGDSCGRSDDSDYTGSGNTGSSNESDDGAYTP